MTESRKILLVGIDYSAIGDAALDTAFALAAPADSGWEPHVASVATPYGSVLRVEVPTDDELLGIDEAAAKLQAHVTDRLARFERDRGQTFRRVVTHLRVGDAATELAQLAADLDADLVVVGTHGRRGLGRVVLGSVAERTVRLARCPVLVARAKDHYHESEHPAPSIEPPCPDCAEARRASAGDELWCARHKEHHATAHRYHYIDRSSSSGGGFGLLAR
ncbi:MAG: universal stress protein [Polyangiaceae bacterium]|nr:universal stress protein [Polyangiaceae bacterium]